MPERFKYQEAGAAWLANRRRAYLADVPGLGKTRQLVTAARALGVHHPFVLVPASALGRWFDEWPDCPGTIESYDVFVRRQRALVADLLICDEAHRLKSPEALRTRYVLGKGAILRATPRIWFASGTPMPNHPGELFTILATCFPERLRALRITSYPQYEDLFLEKQPWDRKAKRIVDPAYARSHPWHITWQITGVKNEATFQWMLFGPLLDGQPAVMLRRTWESPEVLEEMAAMPPILWRRELVTDGGMDLEAFDVMITAWEQGVVSGLHALLDTVKSARQQIGMRKAATVAANILGEMEEGDGPARVVFAYHRSVLDALEGHFRRAGVAVWRVDGSTAADQRRAAEAAFQASEGLAIFLGQNDACKESLTLTRADRVELVEPSFVVDDNVQMVHRIRRHGQHADKLIARIWGLARSYDQRVSQILTTKATLKTKVGL